MIEDKYFKSFTDELMALQGRVRSLISDRHWLSDGEWKESVLKSFLRKCLPSNIAIGNGFIIGREWLSAQQDIILYDSNCPCIFKDGDFVILTADAVYGLIEVKSTFSSEFINHLKKLSNDVEAVNKIRLLEYGIAKKIISGIIYYNGNIRSFIKFKKYVDNLTLGIQAVDFISIGPDNFIRFWEELGELRNFYAFYKLKGVSHTYFINNFLFRISRNTFKSNQWLIFPDDGIKAIEEKWIAENIPL
jgi:hypothetical protein